MPHEDTPNGEHPKSISEAIRIAEEARMLARKADDRTLQMHEELRRFRAEMSHHAAEHMGTLTMLAGDIARIKHRIDRSHAASHDLSKIEEEVEDTKVRMMRHELEEANARTEMVRKQYDSIRAQQRMIRGWIWKVVAGIVVGVAVTWLTMLLFHR
jgi:tRNA G10  N-methylase Trm11